MKYNHVECWGYLEDMPHITDTRKGIPVANLKIIVPSDYSRTIFSRIKVCAYGQLGVDVDDAGYHAEDWVRVVGQLKQDTWTNKETGKLFSRVFIVAKLIEPKNEEMTNDTQIYGQD